MGLHLSANLGTDKLSPDGDEVTCEVEIGTDVDRPESDLNRHIALCIDVSGSMSGSKIRNAKDGIKRAVEVLDDEDHISIVIFSSSARSVLESVQVGPNRRRIKDQISSISTGGGTNILGGMEAARDALKSADGSSGPLGSVLSSEDTELLQWIVLVSDGHPTTGSDLIKRVTPGMSVVEGHEKAADDYSDEGITIHSAGVGSSYNEEIMRGVAEASGGTSEHIGGAEELREFFERIVEEATDVVEVNPTLRIEPLGGVDVDEAYQHKPTLNELSLDSRGSWLVAELPDISGTENQEVLVEFNVPSGEPETEFHVADLTLEAASETADEPVHATYRFPATLETKDRTSHEERKRIDTKARRLAVESSPGDALSFLARQDGDAVAEETEQKIRQLEEAEQKGKESRTLELKNELTSPAGLTKPDEEVESTSAGTSGTGVPDQDSSVGTAAPESTAGSADVEPSEGGEVDVEPSEGGEVDVEPSEGGEVDVKPSEGGEVDVEPREGGEGAASEAVAAKGPSPIAITGIPDETNARAGESVRITVRDGNGNRVEGATVAHEGRTETTDTRGICSLEFASPGEHVVEVSKDDGSETYGGDSVTIHVEDNADETERASLSEASGGTANEASGDDEPVGLALLAESDSVSVGEPLQLTVRDESGARVEGVTVEYADGTAETGSRGTCVIEFSAPGRYPVEAATSSENHESTMTTIEVEE